MGERERIARLLYETVRSVPDWEGADAQGRIGFYDMADTILSDALLAQRASAAGTDDASRERLGNILAIHAPHRAYGKDTDCDECFVLAQLATATAEQTRADLEAAQVRVAAMEKEWHEHEVCVLALTKDYEAARARVGELTEELEEWWQITHLQAQRERPFIERWRKETGQPLSLPDYGAMLDWLMAKAEQAEQQGRALRGFLTDLQWSGGQDRHGCGFCPDCYQTSPDGHTPRCGLAALLTDTEDRRTPR